MAIKLARVLDNGFEANYWRVIQVQADADNKIISGMAVVYKDKEARLSGAKPAAPPTLFNFKADSITGNLVSLVYEYLKREQLNGGEDE